MNGKTVSNRFKPLLLVAFIMLLNQTSRSTTMVNFPLTANNQPAVGYSAGNSGCLLLASTTTGGNLSYDPNKGTSTSGWNTVGQYWYTSAINASSFYSLSITVQMNSEAFDPYYGPRDFKLQYSINGGANWSDVQQLNPLSATLTGQGTISLPSDCNYKTDVRIRFITTSTWDIEDPSFDVEPTAKSFIKGLVISGEQLLPPTTQSSNISVVAMTPTSISVDCSPGTGTNRIIVINTSNTFTAPIDDFTPTLVSPNYSGAGQQVIYDGTGSSVTVNVLSSKNLYYFRIYDYNLNSGKKRYNISTDFLNPKECQLENVILPTVINIRLTTADLGGTITSPASGTITERGIYWSTTPGVSVYSQKVITTGTDIGVFSFTASNFPRSSAMIYFKAYVNNLSGTALSEEASFSNIPIFTGTDYWENFNFWNVKQVPGLTGAGGYGSSLDSPVIEGNCTIDNSNTCRNLTINNGGKLTINAEKTLTVTRTLTNNATTSGLVVKSGNGTTANASLIFTNKALNQNVPASVEMYSIANTLGGQNHWQYFGIPVQSQTVGTTFSGGSERVRRYNEANNDINDRGLWYPYPSLTMSSGETLSPVVGYEVVQTSPKPYTFKGNLNTNDFNHPLAYTDGAKYQGQNILANPFTAAIDIPTLLSNNPTLDESAVYLYNTGSREEWEANNGEITPGSNPGTYSVSTGGFAGIFGVPAQIPSMQGFLMKTNSLKTLNISYNTLVVVSNTKPQRSPSDSRKVATMIDVVSSKSSDRMWIFSEPSCTRNFDNGFDGRKILGYNTQIFAMEESEDYQIDAVNDINNTYLGFQSGSETNFKLRFTHQNLEDKYASVYLVDLEKDTMINITASGTEYIFTAVPSTTPSQRFKITTSTTDNVTSPNEGEQIKIFGSHGNAIVQNLSNAQGNVFVYTMAGQFVRNVPFSANGVTTISNLKAGAYIVKGKTATKEVNSYLIIR